MQIPAPNQLSTWNSVPPLERHEEATALVWEALDAHAALDKLPVDERPTFWGYADHCFLAETKTGVRYELQDAEWWEAITTPPAARTLADDLVSGLRERIRGARKAGRAGG